MLEVKSADETSEAEGELEATVAQTRVSNEQSRVPSLKTEIGNA